MSQIKTLQKICLSQTGGPASSVFPQVLINRIMAIATYEKQLSSVNCQFSQVTFQVTPLSGLKHIFRDVADRKSPFKYLKTFKSGTAPTGNILLSEGTKSFLYDEPPNGRDWNVFLKKDSRTPYTLLVVKVHLLPFDISKDSWISPFTSF